VRIARARGLGLVVAGLAGCGPPRADAWIDEDAAVVWCALAGRSEEAPALLRELPLPELPTGLYASGLDGGALVDLGFTPGAAVCASLVAPRELELVEAESGLRELVAARDRVAREAAAEGECACEVARRLGKPELVPGCMDQAWRPACEVGDGDLWRLKAIVAPLEELLARTPVPMLHWRVVGAADRPGRFAEHPGPLLGRHPGGSEVFLRGEVVPDRLNHRLVSGLLAHDDVVAVVRQDRGAALLVVRVVGGEILVLDLFARTTPAPELAPLLAQLDNLQVDRYVAALARPDVARRLGADPRTATVVELDAVAWARIEAGRTIAAGRPDRGSGGEEPAFVRVTLSQPRRVVGDADPDPEHVHATLRASVSGASWLDALVAGGWAAAPPDRGPPGRPGAAVWFTGGAAFLGLVQGIERAIPGSLTGSPRSWTLDLPTGPLPAGLAGDDPQLAALRERLSKDPHRLVGRIDVDVVELELSRR
jgi:hypothetical protein